SCRIFVAPNNEARALWVAKLWDAKKASLKKMIKMPVKEPSAEELNNETEFYERNGFRGGINGFPDAAGIVSGEKIDTATTSTKRVRAYWGVDRHPELIIKVLNAVGKPDENEEISKLDDPSATSSTLTSSLHPEEKLSQRLIRGGSIDSLIHELIFETQKGNQKDGDEFLHAFLLTYQLYTEPSHIFRELKRCTSMRIEEDDQPNKIVKRLITILITWCQSYGRDLLREDVWKGMIEIIEEVVNSESITDAENLKKLMQDTRDEFKNENEEEFAAKSPLNYPASSPLSLDLSNLLVT
ncbi:8375_t:CDS:1, partial [Acaulospora morrowiae]